MNVRLMNLFSQLAAEPTYEELYPGALLMRGLALLQDAEFFAAVEAVLAAAPLRNATTPSGLPMSVMVGGVAVRMKTRDGSEVERCSRTFLPIKANDVKSFV